jgi:hypothetical protein
MSKTFIALFREQVVILYSGFLTSVEFSDGSIYLSCELAPISEFEIIGEL